MMKKYETDKIITTENTRHLSYIRMQWNLVNVNTDISENSACGHYFRGKEFQNINLPLNCMIHLTINL